MRLIGLAVTLSLTLAPLAADAQPGRVNRIEVIISANPAADVVGASPREWERAGGIRTSRRSCAARAIRLCV
jgi:hypothetical protein